MLRPGKGSDLAVKKERPVKGDGIKVEKTLKKRRVDDFSTGLVDLVTDRVKNPWFSIFAVVLFPLVLMNIAIVRQISSVTDNLLDQIPANMVILKSPKDMVLGVKSNATGAPLRVMVVNQHNLPVQDSQVTISVVSFVPEERFDFCDRMIPNSMLDERLGAVCQPILANNEKSTDSSGIAIFDDFAVVAGVPGSFVINVTVSKVREFTDAFGRTAVQPVIGTHSWFQVNVRPNLNITITPTTRPPKAIEYLTEFKGQGTVCSRPANGDASKCSQGERDDLRPPAASIRCFGDDGVSNETRITFFVIANFSEVLWDKVEFPRTNYPHSTGSVDRMARITSSAGGFQLRSTFVGQDGSVGLSSTEGGWEGSVEWPGFKVLGSTNPALFFAFYSCGVFAVWNENWEYSFPGNIYDGRPPETTRQVVEVTMLPNRDQKGIRPGEGEWWIGGVAPALIGDDGVAVGDQAYLAQVQITNIVPPKGRAANEVLEGETFQMQLNTLVCSYPRARCAQKYSFVKDVTIFAEAVPVSGIMASDRKAFKQRSKVLLNAVSAPSTESATVFDNLAFSLEGDEGEYRIRVYAEGRWHHDSEVMIVRTRVNLVMLKLPASVQMKWPGCDNLMTLPPTDANSDGNPDSDFPYSQEMAICFNVLPFVPLTDLPYVEAYECSLSQGKLAVQSLLQSCNLISGKRVKVTIHSPSWETFSSNENGERIWTWPKVLTDLTRDREITELPAVSYEQSLPVVDPKHELSSLTINHMFKKSMYLSFSVGGSTSPMKVAIGMNDTSALQGALTSCIGTFSPIAYLEILDEKNFDDKAEREPVTVWPGKIWKAKVFAVDMHGMPAKGRPICMRLFELDWHDYFADGVKLHDDYRRLNKERERNPDVNLDNFTYYNRSCWMTDQKGIANVETWWDMQEVKFRVGAFGYYFESNEWEDIIFYKRQGSRWFINDPEKDIWRGKKIEHTCLASFGFHVPNVRTHSYYIYLRQGWAETPTAVYSTARWPQLFPTDLKSFFPQHGTYYGSTDRRKVEAGKVHDLHVRLYQGNAKADFDSTGGNGGVYPKKIICKSFLIHAPPNFPKDMQKCYRNEPYDTRECYQEVDFELIPKCESAFECTASGVRISDDYGYCTFSFKAAQRYLGVFRVVIAVGLNEDLAYDNEFSQVFEIEVVPFRGLPIPNELGVLGKPGCSEVDSLVQLGKGGLSPNLRYYQFCPLRNPDGSCSWDDSLCPSKVNVLTLNDNSFLGSPASDCIPLGTAFPNPVTASVINELGEPVSGFAFYLHGAPGSETMKLHPSLSQVSDKSGKAIANTVVLDYALPGTHKLQLSMRLDGVTTWREYSAISKSFQVTDHLLAQFVRQPPGFVVTGYAIDPHVCVQVRIKRNCFSTVGSGSGQHEWNPPTLSMHIALVSLPGDNRSKAEPLAKRWDTLSSIWLNGTEATPTFTPDTAYLQIAVANFTDLTILSGLQGVYQLHVTVQGTDQVLASSLPFEVRRYARTLRLLKPMPSYPNADRTHIVTVKASSAGGLPIGGAFITVKLEARDKENERLAGLKINTDKNVTGKLDLAMASAVTGKDGIATIAIVFRHYTYPGKFVLRFIHSGAPDLFSSVFEIIPPIKELEIISNPSPDPFFPPSIVWVDLKASFPTPPGYSARKIVVQENPAAMKGSIIGESVDDPGPVIRAKDHRGFALMGLDFNVTLVDYQDNIMDVAVSATRGERLATDLGLSKELPICPANGSRFDCDGLYSFEKLATENYVKSGFYRWRFECEGMTAVQAIDLVFMNEYMPNILRLTVYMYLSMGSCGVILLLFQMNRLDRLIFQKYTAKYLQRPEERILYGLMGTAGIALFGWFSYLFFVTLVQSKTPPHEPEGYLLPTDVMANWSTWILYLVVLASCLHAFWVMSQKRESFSGNSPEIFLRKLGMNAKVAEARRSFVGKMAKQIDKPPRLTAARGRFAKKMEKYKNKVRDLWKYWKMIKTGVFYVFVEGKKLYVRLKYSNPAFKSLYFAWPDVFYGIRFRSSLLLNTLLLSISCLVGLWFGEKFSSMLTKYYGTYLSMVIARGSTEIDWFEEIWTNKGGLGTIQQVTVLFHARTSSLGEPFFFMFLSAFRYSSLMSTILATVVIFARVVIMAIEQRETICNLRMGAIKKEVGDLKQIPLIDGCAYLGSQGILMCFGWFAFFVFAYTGLFSLSWDTTRRVLYRLWFPMMLASFFLYVLFYWMARIRVTRNPGLTVVGRGQFAFIEFLLLFGNILFGPFLAFARFVVAVFRTMMTWFLLHNKIHEAHEVSGVGNGMYKAAIYVHHAHNNPVTRALVDRLHIQLRNLDTMRRFPPDNIEPDRLRKEVAENRNNKIQRRIIARLLLLLLMKANEHHSLEARRKQHMAIYQRKMRKGVFAAGADDDAKEGELGALETHDEDARLNELLSMENDNDDAHQEASEEEGEEEDTSEIDSSRKSTTRSLPKLPNPFGSGRKKTDEED